MRTDMVEWTRAALRPDSHRNGRCLIFSCASATLKASNNLIYMSSLTEVISSAVVIATQSQLRDYRSQHNVKAEQCF